jgi:hypothetical protein
MKALLLALCLAASACEWPLRTRPVISAIVDMPEVITLTHASPDSWHTLPPVEPNYEPTSNVAYWDVADSSLGRIKEEIHEATR